MISNIKQLWERMLPQTKREAVEILKSEFDLINTAFVRQTWISSGAIPIDKQERVLRMFVQIVKLQEQKSVELTQEAI